MSSVFLRASKSLHRIKLIQFWPLTASTRDGWLELTAYIYTLNLVIKLFPMLPLVVVQTDSILFKYVDAGDLEFCIKATEL